MGFDIEFNPELSIMLETMMIEFIQIQSELIIKSPSFMGEVRRVSTFSSLKPNENSLDG